MKRNRLLPFVALACLGLPMAQPLFGQDAKVLLIVKDGPSLDLEYVLTQEVGVMTAMLQEAGLQVVVASPGGEPFVGEETTLTPDMKLADVAMSDFAGIIMPCMALEEDPENADIERLVKEAVASGKPVAAQLGSVVHLARAGVLEGKKYAYVEEFIELAPELEGLEYGGQGIVDEGDIVTSGVCPHAARALELEDTTPALTKALIAKIKG